MTVPAYRPHHIYRHFAADGELLYVGVTCSPTKRPYVRYERPWLDDSVRVEVSGPMSMWDAYRAENGAIRDERPSRNTQRSNAWLRWYAEATDRALSQWTEEEQHQMRRCSLSKGFEGLHLAGLEQPPPFVEVHASCIEIRMAAEYVRLTGEVLPRTQFTEVNA